MCFSDAYSDAASTFANRTVKLGEDGQGHWRSEEYAASTLESRRDMQDILEHFQFRLLPEAVQ
ncbi:hypothetical protein SERLA73DRAFT_136331 [Serpula lacrymans var. lacrymans S7.3]|uniref:Uncharacterized protein n=2 Tax=Serpula lacrymans var. lacrymans TaxID=341189 RepID=F8PUN9_SERL3|nr:uncharacterized protein SERLADRAFT_388802 [Serpula lacrymans var. lacrymans S7.9]EGO00447.1 hypothetical protein SERLA73DRAFT_136331 [Serpula lacrymans var. lacrymans S7.3]EGO26003.1 hypothetical protein SERLADRAFT_388802 [Serpula lacrymans var. lacrymans S7.9]